MHETIYISCRIAISAQEVGDNRTLLFELVFGSLDLRPGEVAQLQALHDFPVPLTVAANPEKKTSTPRQSRSCRPNRRQPRKSRPLAWRLSTLTTWSSAALAADAADDRPRAVNEQPHPAAGRSG